MHSHLRLAIPMAVCSMSDGYVLNSGENCVDFCVLVLECME